MTGTKKSSTAVNILLTVFGVYTVFPIYMAVVNSFKEQKEIYYSTLSLPKTLVFSNYMVALTKMNFFHTLTNTFIIAVLGGAGIIFFSSLAGYKLSRTPGRLSNFIFLLFVSSMLIPFHSIMITLVKEARALSLHGSLYGLAVIYIGLGINMAVFLYHGFVKSIPKELEESARVDGSGEFVTFFKIILPTLKPITATIAILNALWMWNDFLLPLLMLNKMKNYTLTLMTYTFFDKYNTEWPNVLAALVLVAIPLVIFYIFLQKYIIEGMTSGAIKG